MLTLFHPSYKDHVTLRELVLDEKISEKGNVSYRYYTRIYDRKNVRDGVQTSLKKAILVRRRFKIAGVLSLFTSGLVDELSRFSHLLS